MNEYLRTDRLRKASAWPCRERERERERERGTATCSLIKINKHTSYLTLSQTSPGFYVSAVQVLGKY